MSTRFRDQTLKEKNALKNLKAFCWAWAGQDEITR